MNGRTMTKRETYNAYANWQTIRNPKLPTREEAFKAFESERGEPLQKATAESIEKTNNGMETVKKEQAREGYWYHKNKGLLDKHVLSPGATWICEFVAVKDLKDRITKRHPSFALQTQSIAEYLVLQHGYKSARHEGVMGYWLATDGELLEPLQAKKAKRRRVAKERRGGQQLSLASSLDPHRRL